MATFTIKRGDSMPPVIVSMRIAGSDPERFWDINLDDVGDVVDEDNWDVNQIQKVQFIMTNIATGEMVGRPANVALRFTGLGKIYEKDTGEFYDPPTNSQPIKKTLLRYNWAPPDLGFDPTDSTETKYGGDTAVAGTYRGEFEVYYDTAEVDVEKRKRTFPSTSGDSLIIQILADDNDKRYDESE